MYIQSGQARVHYLLHDVNMALHRLIFRVIPLNIPRGGGDEETEMECPPSPPIPPPPPSPSLLGDGRREG
jgi:hypothetical protein